MKRTYWITAGHGGTDPGAIATHYGVTYREADLALELRELVSEHLRRWGHTVNNEGNATPLKDVQAWMLREVKPTDVCLDIHFNAGKGRGVECFIRTHSTHPEVQQAMRLCKAVADAGKLVNRGVASERQTRHGRLASCNYAGICALLEVCFIDTEQDIRLYLDNKQAIAEAIAKALIS